MGIQEKIRRKQNDPEMLKCQYAARTYFNRSEKLSYCLLLTGLASASCAFIPDQMGWFPTLFPAVLDLSAVILEIVICKNVATASALRNYFDYIVLGIGSTAYSDYEIENIRENISLIVSKNASKCKEQISNTGEADPPGVKDWYAFADNDEPDEKVLLSCQKQTCWWNRKMTIARLIISTIVAIAIFGGFILCALYTGISKLKLIACGIAIFLIAVERAISNVKYLNISIKIQNTLEAFDKTSATMEHLSYLQDLINERRTFTVLEINWLHKQKSKAWSAQYAERSGIKKGQHKIH